MRLSRLDDLRQHDFIIIVRRVGTPSAVCLRRRHNVLLNRFVVVLVIRSWMRETLL